MSPHSSRLVAIPLCALALAFALSAGGAAAGGPGKHQAPPTNTALPTVSGVPTVGQTLSGSAGSWSGNGISFSYEWLRCDTAGGACTSLLLGASTAWTLSAADQGHTIRLAVTARNQNGSATATSAASPAVAAAIAPSPVPPSNSTRPAVSGQAVPGSTLTGSNGTWSGTAPLTSAYQWLRCDASGAACASVSGASASTFAVTAADVGHTIGVAVTAQNLAGTTTAQSNPTAVVQAAPAGTPQPTFPIRAAFYYPWFPETWTVNGAHVRYRPSLDYYSTTDLATQQAHIRALTYAGMDSAISSWWGPNQYNNARLQQLMNTTVAMGSSLKWSTYYENEGYGDPTVAQLVSDLTYIRDNLATSSAYLKVGGKFVVFVYNSDDNTCEVADRWKQANAALGNAAYIDLKVFLGYRNCASQPNSWHQYGPDGPADEQPGFSYSVSPGWWRADQSSPVLARDPARWQSNVKAMVASGEPWQLVTTFNEWTEGTAVESAVDWGSSSGYGTYLDALHTATGGN